MWNMPQFQQRDAEIVDLETLLIMNGKRLSSKTSNLTTSLTAHILTSLKTQTALDK